MIIKRKQYSSIKDRLKTSGIISGIGAGLGAGLGLLSKQKSNVIAGGILGATLGAGLGFIARDPKDKINTSTNIKQEVDNLNTPEINNKFSKLPKEYFSLSKLNDTKLTSLMPDRESDEFFYIDVVDENSIRKQLSLGLNDITIFRVVKSGPIDINYDIQSKKLKMIRSNKIIPFYNINDFKRFIISEIKKDNTILKNYIDLGEDFEDILKFQEYYIEVLNKQL